MHQFIVLIFTSLSLTLMGTPGNTQCLPEDMTTVEGSVPVMPSYTLSKPNGIAGSTIGYCPEYYQTAYGASYLLLFEDQGGSGMDGYPCIKAGGARYDNDWHPGDFELTGMPVQIRDIDPDMYFELIYHQEEALDDDDKWMASVNFIFDIYGTETSKPVTEERDFDIVVKAQSHRFDSDILTDQPIPVNTRFWFFARHEDGSLKTYDIEIDNIIYNYAVRYKFFEGNGAKDNKAHVKFIPVGPAGTPPTMKINVKEIINVSKEYIDYAAMPEEKRVLAEKNIGTPKTWLKGINAGYEVYTGESILRIQKYKVYPGNIQTFIHNNNQLLGDFSIYPVPTFSSINWDIQGVVKATLYDVNGTQSSLLVRDNCTNIIDFPTGIYFLELLTEDGLKVIKKIVKSK